MCVACCAIRLGPQTCWTMEKLTAGGLEAIFSLKYLPKGLINVVFLLNVFFFLMTDVTHSCLFSFGEGEDFYWL